MKVTFDGLSTGVYGLRTLDIHDKPIEKHNSDFLKSGIIQLDTNAEKLGFSRQISGFDDLEGLEKADYLNKD